MNREIKFRAWDDKEKKWLLGYELPNLGGFSMKGEVMIFGEYTMMLGKYSLQDLDFVKIMQWSGLYDKNKKEIYEGDILRMIKDGQQIGADERVDFHNGSFWLWHRYIPLWQWFGDLGFDGEVEIIGNIYETPSGSSHTLQKWTEAELNDLFFCRFNGETSTDNLIDEYVKGNRTMKSICERFKQMFYAIELKGAVSREQ